MIPLLIAGGLLIGTVLIVANWNDIVDWIRDFIPKLKAAWEKIRPHVPYEMQFLSDKIVEAGEHLVQIIHKFYYRDEKTNDLMEGTTIRKVNESEVPPHILAKLSKKQPADISQEMELILEN